jgi:voltage-gated potassium channel
MLNIYKLLCDYLKKKQLGLKNMRKFTLFITPLLLILVIGPLGYMTFEHTSFIDGLYLTVITITTVGYGDIVPIQLEGRLFTVVLIFSGVGYVMYLFSQVTEAMVTGGILKFVERRKMRQKITKLNNHYIVCGFGRIGQEICSILQENNISFVVIEQDGEIVKEIEQLGYIELPGNASDDHTLLEAGIDQASGLIAVVSSDADNVYITLTARGLNPDLFILARSSGVRGVDKKLERAGATRVISPYSIGANRMAQLIVRPTVMDFLDMAMRATELGLCLEELVVREQTAFAGQSLIESKLRQEYNVIVVAIKRAEQTDDAMLFNPGPDTRIKVGDIMIVIGNRDHITALENIL